MLIDRARASLLIVDMQERLLPAMAAPEETLKRCGVLLQAAKALGVPVAASEQYPRGLGPTVAALRDQLGNAPVFEKTAFSCWREAGLRQHFVAHHEAGRPQVVIGGIEAHVCVLQTAIDMAQAGFAVSVVADAASSRAPQSVSLALDRMRTEGIAVVNTEMAVFELLGSAASPEFKALSGLIR